MNIIGGGGVKVTQNVAQYTLHYVNYAPVKFEVATPNGKGNVFTGIKPTLALILVTQNIVQYPLNYVNYALVKLKVTRING